jgi:hypothetical protein
LLLPACAIQVSALLLSYLLAALPI